MIIDLSRIPTPELWEIRNILKHGAKATAETKKAKEFKRLQAENAELKRKESRRALLADISIDIDDDESYWLGLSDSLFDFVVKKCSEVKTEVAIAERTQSLKIPPMISQRELSVLDTVRQGFNEIRDRRNGGYSNELAT